MLGFFCMLADLFLLIFMKTENNPIELISRTSVLCVLPQTWSSSTLMWHRKFLSFHLWCPRLSEEMRITESVPLQSLHCPASHFPPSTWALPPSASSGAMRKSQVQWTGGTPLASQEGIKGAKKWKVTAMYNQPQKIAFKFNVWAGPIKQWCPGFKAAFIPEQSRVSCWLRKTTCHNARPSRSYSCALGETHSWEATCSKEGKRQSNLRGSREASWHSQPRHPGHHGITQCWNVSYQNGQLPGACIYCFSSGMS